MDEYKALREVQADFEEKRFYISKGIFNLNYIF